MIAAVLRPPDSRAAEPLKCDGTLATEFLSDSATNGRGFLTVRPPPRSPPTMMTTELARTPLHDWHVAHGGRMVDFAGWSMPVQYSSIADEHNATRNAVGVFDISHMGRLQFFGRAAPQFLDSIVTRRVTDMKPNQIRYALVCNEDGGILDDVLVYAGSPDRRVRSRWSSTPATAKRSSPGSNSRQLERAGIPEMSRSIRRRHAANGDDRRARAQALSRFMQRLDRIADCPSPDMRYYTCATGYFRWRSIVVVSRTGYTGEDGFEIICDAEQAVEIWEHIIEAADDRRRHGCRSRRPRHAAARSGDAAVRPRAVGDDQSNSSRA